MAAAGRRRLGGGASAAGGVDAPRGDAAAVAGFRGARERDGRLAQRPFPRRRARRRRCGRGCCSRGRSLAGAAPGRPPAAVRDARVCASSTRTIRGPPRGSADEARRRRHATARNATARNATARHATDTRRLETRRPAADVGGPAAHRRRVALCASRRGIRRGGGRVRRRRPQRAPGRRAVCPVAPTSERGGGGGVARDPARARPGSGPRLRPRPPGRRPSTTSWRAGGDGRRLPRARRDDGVRRGPRVLRAGGSACTAETAAFKMLQARRPARAPSSRRTWLARRTSRRLPDGELRPGGRRRASNKFSFRSESAAAEGAAGRRSGPGPWRSAARGRGRRARPRTTRETTRRTGVARRLPRPGARVGNQDRLFVDAAGAAGCRSAAWGAARAPRGGGRQLRDEAGPMRAGPGAGRLVERPPRTAPARAAGAGPADPFLSVVRFAQAGGDGAPRGRVRRRRDRSAQRVGCVPQRRPGAGDHLRQEVRGTARRADVPLARRDPMPNWPPAMLPSPTPPMPFGFDLSQLLGLIVLCVMMLKVQLVSEMIEQTASDPGHHPAHPEHRHEHRHPGPGGDPADDRGDHPDRDEDQDGPDADPDAACADQQEIEQIKLEIEFALKQLEMIRIQIQLEIEDPSRCR